MKRKNFEKSQQDEDTKPPQEKRQRTTASNQTPIDLVSDDDDDNEAKELAQAIKLSLQQQQPSSSSSTSASSATSSSSQKFKGDRFYLNKLPGAAATEHTLSIEDVIQVDKVKSCFFSTYSFDIVFFQYLFRNVTRKPLPGAKPPSCASVTLAKHYFKGEEKPGKTMVEMGSLPLCIIHPELISPYSNVHSKMFVKKKNFIVYH